MPDTPMPGSLAAETARRHAPLNIRGDFGQILDRPIRDKAGRQQLSHA